MTKKIEAPEGSAAGRDINTTEAPSNNVHSIFGGTNIIGNQGDIHIQTTPPENKKVKEVVVLNPGPNEISEQQKAEIKSLCDEWVALHNSIKKRPLTYGAAWSRINKTGGVTKYAMIPQAKFKKVVAFIKKEMGQLRNMKSAPAKDDQWRAKRIGAIKARSKNQLGDPNAYKPYIKKNFKADSLTELSTDEIQRTYTYIFAKKKTI
ncbi:ORF6C domain-containing protein [Oceanospirillum beijerinckii]|uniref:ORF6C domain-containing protein n=1 Tax=Oceanospirillum beijerinckii TaxID=64976 RepID=UPI00042A5EA0|nr:ORF6C domain-containing protein [Oceanospirillum beijerinckii]